MTVVDGHFKSEFDTAEAAETAGRKLKSAYPMLQIEIYDAANQGPHVVELDWQGGKGALRPCLDCKRIARYSSTPASCGVNW